MTKKIAEAATALIIWLAIAGAFAVIAQVGSSAMIYELYYEFGSVFRTIGIIGMILSAIAGLIYAIDEVMS